MSEQQIQRKIIKWLEAEGHYVVKVISASKAGVPDVLACVRGKFIAIEVKTPGTKTNTSPLQDYNLSKIKDAGGISMVAWELEQVQRMIDGTFSTSATES
jgi:Holliday junction resolvase